MTRGTLPAYRGRIAGGGRRRAGGGEPADDLHPPPITVAAALARNGRVTLTGTEATGRRVGTVPVDVTYDLQPWTSIGYSAFDSANNTAICPEVGTECGTPHGRATKAINLSPGSATTGLVMVGGHMYCDSPELLPWEPRKHGWGPQRVLDQGGDPYPINGGSNDTVMVLATIRAGGWCYADGTQIGNTQDGFRAGGPGGATRWLRNIYAYGPVADTFLEGENGDLYFVYDSLIRRAYGLVDVRNIGRPTAGANVFEYCIINLAKLPGGFKKRSWDTSHDKVHKKDGNSPRLRLRRCVLALSDDGLTSDGALGLYPSDTFEDVVVLWLGDGPYPGTVMEGMTVVNRSGNDRQAAQSRLDAATARWMDRHGVVGPGQVDQTRIVAPDLLTWPI